MAPLAMGRVLSTTGLALGPSLRTCGSRQGQGHGPQAELTSTVKAWQAHVQTRLSSIPSLRRGRKCYCMCGRAGE